MNPSWRKPAGIGIILSIIVIWSVIVASAAPMIDGAHWSFEALFYLIAGTAWILPLKPLLSWMEIGRRHI